MSTNLVNSSILPKRFSTAVNKHSTIQIDYKDNASRSTIQTILLNTQNYERTIQLFKMSTVIKMCEMIWSNLNTVPTPRTGERVTQGTSLHNIIILFFKIDNKTLQSKTQLEAKELTILKLILKKSTK